MAYMTTEYDYSIKQEVFKITGEKGYVHKTDTVLKRVTESDGSFTPPVITHLHYCTVAFTLNVLRDYGTSNIVFYDNDTIIPFKYCTTLDGSYTSTSMLEWTQQTEALFIKIDLSYGVEHNIQARYLGNKQGLPSRSLSIPFYQELPNAFEPTFTFSYDSTEFNEEVIIIDNDSEWEINVNFDGYEGGEDRTLKVFLKGETQDTLIDTLTTDSSGDAQIVNTDGTTFSDGINYIRVAFDGDYDYVSYEKTIVVYLGIKTTVEVQPIRPIFGQTIVYDVTLTDYKDNPISNEVISLWRED